LRWGIFETGCRVDAAAATGQAAWWPAVFAYVEQADAHCFLLWNSPANGPGESFTFQIDAFPSLVTAWRTAMRTFSQAELDACVAIAVAVEKAAGDAAAAGEKAAGVLALQDEQARSAIALVDAQAAVAAVTAHVADLRASVDAVLAGEGTRLRAVVKTTVAGVRSQVAALLT